MLSQSTCKIILSSALKSNDKKLTIIFLYLAPKVKRQTATATNETKNRRPKLCVHTKMYISNSFYDFYVKLWLIYAIINKVIIIGGVLPYGTNHQYRQNGKRCCAAWQL
jgi:hypothetical protein